MNRRNFLQLTAAATLAQSLPAASQTLAKARLTLTGKAVTTMPLDFTGLSYESPQLANTAFFSSENTELVQLFRELGPTGGVLRTGGNISAFTLWRDHSLSTSPVTPAEQAVMNKGKRYWEWDLTDPTIRHGNHEAVFTPASIETLASFLRATGWRVLYGLNFANGTAEQAAAEVACVMRLCCASVLGFQLGNEVEYWSGGFRPKPWDFETYYAEWQSWVRTIHASTPHAPIAGPDVAANLTWVEKLAEAEGKNLAVLTKHHYVMGPAGAPGIDANRLLGPDPDVQKEIDAAQRAKAFAGVGFRNAESGSCFHGGQPGVSNAYASALWGADYMLALAQGGHAGVNMHGGGEGFYSPITGDTTKGFTRQPLFYGMRFAQHLADATLQDLHLDTNANFTAYAGLRDHDLLLALINKDAMPVEVNLQVPHHATIAPPREVLQLAGPALDSRTGITFGPMTASQLAGIVGAGAGVLRVDPYSALLLRYQDSPA